MLATKKNIVDEIHGCIICANLFNVLAVYTPDGKLLDCTVTSPGGHIAHRGEHLLVACDSHAADEIEAIRKRALFIHENAAGK